MMTTSKVVSPARPAARRWRWWSWVVLTNMVCFTCAHDGREPMPTARLLTRRRINSAQQAMLIGILDVSILNWQGWQCNSDDASRLSRRMWWWWLLKERSAKVSRMGSGVLEKNKLMWRHDFRLINATTTPRGVYLVVCWFSVCHFVWNREFYISQKDLYPIKARVCAVGFQCTHPRLLFK